MDKLKKLIENYKLGKLKPKEVVKEVHALSEEDDFSCVVCGQDPCSTDDDDYSDYTDDFNYMEDPDMEAK